MRSAHKLAKPIDDAPALLLPLRGNDAIYCTNLPRCACPKGPLAYIAMYRAPSTSPKGGCEGPTPPKGGQRAERIQHFRPPLGFSVNILPRRGPKGRAHTAPLGAGKVSASLSLASPFGGRRRGSLRFFVLRSSGGKIYEAPPGKEIESCPEGNLLLKADKKNKKGEGRYAPKQRNSEGLEAFSP